MPAAARISLFVSAERPDRCDRAKPESAQELVAVHEWLPDSLAVMVALMEMPLDVPFIDVEEKAHY